MSNHSLVSVSDPNSSKLHSKSISDQECITIELSPIDQANLFSSISYSWLNPLFKLGASKPLTELDMYPLLMLIIIINYLNYIGMRKFNLKILQYYLH